MKYRPVLLSALCTVLLSAPLYAGEARSVESGSQLEKAVMLAAPGSDASLEDIMLSVYEAVQQAPDDAVAIFETVVAQRENWTADQIYGILRAVEMANPSMMNNPALIAALSEVAIDDGLIQEVASRMNIDTYMLREMNIRYARGRMGGGTMGINTNYSSGPVDQVIPTPGAVSPQN